MRVGRVVVLCIWAVLSIAAGGMVAAPLVVGPVLRPVLSWLVSLPSLAMLAIVGVVSIFMCVVTTYVAGLATYHVWKRVWPRFKWFKNAVVPSSMVLQFATGAIGLVTVILLIGAIPFVVSAGANAVGGVGGISGSLEETNGYISQLNEGTEVDGLGTLDGSTEWRDGAHLSDDEFESALSGGSGCLDEAVDGPDTDNDGLPDRWERQGETPSGVQLPGADPEQKDLYVQTNNGTNVRGLSQTEREQLRTIWAEMPVENPDGTTGIDIHIAHTPPRGGSLGEAAVFESNRGTSRYYTEEVLGGRHCVYHQTTYGDLEMGNIVGYGEAPGYATIVEGRYSYGGERASHVRLGVTTHELLHNIVGRINGGYHTSEGLLASGSSSNTLSETTASHLNETGLYGPASHGSR